MDHPSRLNADLAYEVDDVPVLRFLRDYAIPLVVWLVMMRFLCGQVVIPMFSSGMLTQMRRQPTDEGADGDDEECDNSAAGDPAATTEGDVSAAEKKLQ
mmetsp:Transcript_191/g.755  ORF Transcript_191/g.755 Transcript_191/m.755 type:complete len:99 (+) Transcript_191:30-326(+)